MWKTAETLYKPHMRLRVFRSHPCLKKHAETPTLDVEIFAVLVWQIEEHAIRFANSPPQSFSIPASTMASAFGSLATAASLPRFRLRENCYNTMTGVTDPLGVSAQTSNSPVDARR